jgi:two-component sensor histidine kinase
VSAILGRNSKATRLLSTSGSACDKRPAISKLKEQVKRQALLTTQLQHRIKNTLAIVAAIANQTMRGDNVAAARDAFAARLATLSNAHDILTQAKMHPGVWTRVGPAA